MAKKIKKEAPEINISEICEQYYHRSPFCNYTPESNKLIFRNALYRENEEQFGLFKQKNPVGTPVFRLTGDMQLLADESSPMKSIREEPKHEDDDPLRTFSLHRYTLPQKQIAYKAFMEARRGIVYAAKEYKRYKKMKESEQVQITDDQIVAEMRRNPELAHLADIIQNPVENALMTMLITYEKYNYQTEEKGLSSAFIQKGPISRFDDQSEPMYNEIELMKELVLEFGEAINKRIHDIDEKAA